MLFPDRHHGLHHLPANHLPLRKVSPGLVRRVGTLHVYLADLFFRVCVSTRRETHLCCDILPIIVNDTGKIIIKIVSNLLCLAFFIFVTYHGAGVIQKLINRPQVSAAMQINMIWAYIGPYVGAFIASIHYVILIFREIDVLISMRSRKEVGSNE